ncbi:RND transporter, partial [Stutzerimonas stutzeri]
MMARTALSAVLAATLALAACSNVPPQPPPELPPEWFGPASAAPLDEQALADWWQRFDDPQLSAVVQRAMQRNHDVRLAMQRVEAARAQLRQS